MAEAQVSLEFAAKFDAASRSLDGFARSVDKKLGGIQEGFSSLGKAAAAGLAIFAGRAVVSGFDSIIRAASDAEQATNDMRNSLRLAGDFSEQNASAFERLAESIQATTRYDDDLVISQVAVAKQFGATNREAEKIIRAAVDLAAATGIDLPTATELLGKSLDGTAGRLNELVPGIRSLTSEQLRAAGAADLVSTRFQGAAAAAVGTYAGSVEQLKNQFGQFIESVGDVLVKNTSVKDSIQALGKFFSALSETVSDNRDAMGSLVSNGILIFTKSVTLIISSVRLLHETFEIILRDLKIFMRELGSAPANLKNFLTFNIDAAKQLRKDNLAKGLKDDAAGLQRLKPYDGILNNLAELGASVELALKRQPELAKAVKETGGEFDRQGSKAKGFGAELAQGAKALIDSLKNVGKTELEVITNKFLQNRKLLEDFGKTSTENRIQAEEALHSLRLKNEQEISDLRKREFEEGSAKLRELTQNPVQFFFDQDAIRRAYEEIPKDRQRGIAAGLGGLQAVLGGKEGARKLLGATASQLGSVIAGPAGAALGPIVEALSQGPDQVREMVRSFLDAVPELIENIVDSIPVIVEVLAEKFSDPEFLAKLGVAFAKAATYGMYKVFTDPKLITQIGQTLSNAFTFGSNNFITKILEGAGQFVERMVQGAGRFVEELIKKISDIGGALPGLGGGGGGLTGIIGGITGSIPGFGGGGFGFAEGGVVPDGFPNDTFPAKLTSGEVILNKQQQAALQQPQEITINLQIGQSQLAKVILDLNRLGYRTA